jgi:hypothetical protein
MVFVFNKVLFLKAYTINLKRYGNTKEIISNQAQYITKQHEDILNKKLWKYRQGKTTIGNFHKLGRISTENIFSGSNSSHGGSYYNNSSQIKRF